MTRLRLPEGQAFERQVAEYLIARGLYVSPFGYGDIIKSPTIRAVVREHSLPVRYYPDLLVSDGSTWLIALEVKGHSVPEGIHSHCCEAAQLQALQTFESHHSIPVGYVFRDGAFTFREHIVRLGTLVDDPHRLARSKAKGASGLPFYEMECAHCVSLGSYIDKLQREAS